MGKQGEAFISSGVSLTLEGETWHLPPLSISVACRGSAVHPVIGRLIEDLEKLGSFPLHKLLV